MEAPKATAVPFPERFEFYHLGWITPDTEAKDDLASVPDDVGAWYFSIHGDARGWVAVVSENRGLDLDAVSELGNVIASKVADALSRSREGLVLISEPQFNSGAQLRARVAATASQLSSRPYRWHTAEGRVSLLVFASLQAEDRAEVAHA